MGAQHYTCGHTISNMSVVQLAPDAELVVALRNGDENAFAALIDVYHASLVRVATIYTNDHAQAEDVAQETWIAVLKGINSFEGRSALKTWIFSILANRAKTKSQRERRSISFSALSRTPDDEAEAFEPTVDPSNFADDGWWRRETHPHSWASSPDSPDAAYLSAEMRMCAQQAIDALPPNQRQVITFRDVEGWSSEDVCNVLGVSESNQRVLLHRARAKVRLVLDEYFHEQ